MKAYLLFLLILGSCNNSSNSINYSGNNNTIKQLEASNKNSPIYYKLAYYKGETNHLKETTKEGNFIIIDDDKMSLFEDCKLKFQDSFYLLNKSYYQFKLNVKSGFGYTSNKDTLVFDLIKFEGISRYYYRVNEEVKCK